VAEFEFVPAPISHSRLPVYTATWGVIFFLYGLYKFAELNG